MRRLPSFRAALYTVTLASIIPALAIITVTGIEHRNSLEEIARTNQRRLVDSIVEMQNETVAGVEALLRTVTRFPQFQNQDADGELLVATSLLADHPNLLNITVVNEQGHVTASPGLARGTDLSDRRHISQALETGGFEIGEFITALVNNEPSIPYSIGILDEHQRTIGAVAAVFPVDSYSSVLDGLALPGETVVGLIDHQGIRVFFHPQRETNQIVAPIHADAWDIMYAGPDEGEFEMAGSDGITRIYTYERIRDRHNEPYLYVVMGLPVAEVFRESDGVLIRNFFLMLVVVVVALLTARLLGWSFFGTHLNTVRRTAQRIRNGELSARSGLGDVGHEIGDLASAVDGMAVRLEERVHELEAERERANAALEEKATLLREMHHRVKNNMQFITSIISLQRGSAANVEEFSDSLEARVRSITSVHDLLYTSKDLASVDMTSLLEGLTAAFELGPRAPAVTTIVSCPPLPAEMAIPLSLITNELVTNSVKYAHPAEPRLYLEIRLDSTEDSVRLQVRDNGPGFPETGRPASDSGLGHQLVHALASQLSATVEMQNQNGAAVTITVPRPSGSS